MKTKIEIGESYFKSNSMYLKDTYPTEYVTVIEKINDNHFIVQTDENMQGDAFDFELFTKKKRMRPTFSTQGSKIKSKLKFQKSALLNSYLNIHLKKKVMQTYQKMKNL